MSKKINSAYLSDSTSDSTSDSSSGSYGSSSESSSYYGISPTESSFESATENSDSSDVDYSRNGEEFENDIINNQYMLLYKIGYGSFSSVWLTYDIIYDKFYAIKIQTPDDYDEGLEELKIYEIISKVCKQNKNLHTLMTLKYSFILERDEKKYVCMVMELMAGSMYDVIKTDKYKNGLPPKSVESVEKQLMESIKVLHNFDIIHTDIKPENILICGVNKKYQKIMDKFNKLKLKEKYDENIKELKDEKDGKHKKNIYKILLELNKFIHEIIDFDTILSDRTSDLFTEDQINNIKIKLADFGSIQYEQNLKKEDYYPEVTTRYYRDPRVILGLPYDKTIDLHSANCTMHEIKTGIIKYNPDIIKENSINEKKADIKSTDYYHIELLLNDNLVKLDWIRRSPHSEFRDLLPT